MPAEEPAFLLSRQGSNLNSSDPESDVLPITLRDNFEVANIEKIWKKKIGEAKKMAQRRKGVKAQRRNGSTAPRNNGLRR
jgi:hypothetical protein